MAEFEDVWEELVEYARTEQTVSTFLRDSENQIRYDHQDAITFISNQPDTIPRETWKHAWQELQQEGELTSESFKSATGTYRASVALPFLADALDLESNPSESRVWDPEAADR